MKYFFSLLIAGVAYIAIPAYADQPGQASTVAHCNAAMQVSDYTTAIVYCQAEAEDHALNAADATGALHYDEVMLEAECLAQVAIAQHMTDQDASGTIYTARYLAQDVVNNSADQKLIDIAHRQLAILNNIPTL